MFFKDSLSRIGAAACNIMFMIVMSLLLALVDVDALSFASSSTTTTACLETTTSATTTTSAKTSATTTTTATTTTSTEETKAKAKAKPTPVSLSGNWAQAKLALDDPMCCVVSVSGLDDHLQVLQAAFCYNHNNANNNNKNSFELDLRARIRCGTPKDSHQDCQKVKDSVLVGPWPSFLSSTINDTNMQGHHSSLSPPPYDPVVVAMQELAHGVASLAAEEKDNNDDDDDSLPKGNMDVHMRIVRASNYQALDPMFHTDKCPLRAYVTLRGVGTEFMTRTCSPWDYLTLRSGISFSGAGQGQGVDEGEPYSSLRKAAELEFILMKGDYYYCASRTVTATATATWQQQALSKVWQRTFACVHRSPPAAAAAAAATTRPNEGGSNGWQQRVILSLDLADGMDDREWYQRGQKRSWRSGMTQRKSHLVA